MGFQHHNIRDDNPVTGTTRILIACGIVFLGQMLTDPGDPRLPDPVSAWFGLDNGSPLQLWRWLTYMFVHGDWRHLLFNMWALWIFGPMVERELGRIRFFKLYFLCGILGESRRVRTRMGISAAPFRRLGGKTRHLSFLSTCKAAKLAARAKPFLRTPHW